MSLGVAHGPAPQAEQKRLYVVPRVMYRSANQLDSWNSKMHKDQNCTAQKCGSRRTSGRLDLIDGLPEGHTSHSKRGNGWT